MLGSNIDVFYVNEWPNACPLLTQLYVKNNCVSVCMCELQCYLFSKMQNGIACSVGRAIDI